MNIFARIIYKLMPKEVIAKIVYSSILESKIGRGFQRWIPLTATGIYVVLITLKLTGAMEVEAAIDLLNLLEIQPGASETEITVAVGGFLGLVNKITRMYLAATESTSPAEQKP